MSQYSLKTSRQSLTSHRCRLLLLVLSATLLSVDGQPQHNSRPSILRAMSPVRPQTTTTATNLRIRPEEVDRNSDLTESRSSLTIQPEDRLKLRQSVMDLTKRRRVTAIKPTMSPDVISTPNVYHFFSKKRFERVRINSTRNSPDMASTTEASAGVTLAA